MKGQAYINKKGLAEETDLGNYGITLIRGWREVLKGLLTPKDYVSNTSRLEHGKRVIAPTEVKYKDRDIQIQMLLEGTSADDYLSKLDTFQELISGKIELRIPCLGNKIYKLVYSSCKKYGDYGDKKGIFTLAFNEPNPKDHTSDYE